MQSRLIALPAELRNRIYGFVLVHSENDGVIAPVCDLVDAESVTVIDGRSECVKSIWRGSIEAAVRLESDSKARGFSISKEGQVGIYKIGSTSRKNDAHICTLDCLRQPPVTMVSRQVRDETLPVFYDINRFHIETCNTQYKLSAEGDRLLLKYTTWVEELMEEIEPDDDTTAMDFGIDQAEPANDVLPHRSPVTWWRNIGDTNLRLITHLTVVSRKQPGATEDFTFHFDGSSGKNTISITSPPKQATGITTEREEPGRVRLANTIRWLSPHEEVWCDPDGNGQQWKDDMECGLFVAGLETIFGSWAPFYSDDYHSTDTGLVLLRQPDDEELCRREEREKIARLQERY